ncbi:MAG: hypothetical protein C0417_06810 [Chlorobiaceae bacterium]|nr:hypothetical protein [Chlorobiaceae bacterium]
MTQQLSTRLGDVCTFRKGKKPSITFDEQVAGSQPYLLIESFDGTRENFTNDLSCVLCSEDDTLIVCDGARSGLTSFGHRGYVGSTIAALVPDKGKIFPGFLYHFVNSRYEFLNKSVHGAAVPHIERQLLLGLRFHLPPLTEQERIVRILNEAEEMKRLRAQANNRTTDFIPALFDEMFGDPVKNEKRWTLKSVGELLTLCEYGTSEKADDDSTGIPMLRMGNVSVTGELILNDLKYIKLNESDKKKYLLQKGDILFNRTNSRELVGKTGMWDGRFDAVAASYFIRLRFDEQLESPLHFTVFMNLALMKQRLMSMARGAVGQANINAKELQSIMVPVPPIELQNEFAARVEEIRILELDQFVGEQKVESLFQSLLHRAFEGEL